MSDIVPFDSNKIELIKRQIAKDFLLAPEC